MNFIDPKELDIPNYSIKNRYRTILPSEYLLLRSSNTSKTTIISHFLLNQEVVSVCWRDEVSKVNNLTESRYFTSKSTVCPRRLIKALCNARTSFSASALVFLDEGAGLSVHNCSFLPANQERGMLLSIKLLPVFSFWGVHCAVQGLGLFKKFKTWSKQGFWSQYSYCTCQRHSWTQ